MAEFAGGAFNPAFLFALQSNTIHSSTIVYRIYGLYLPIFITACAEPTRSSARGGDAPL